MEVPILRNNNKALKQKSSEANTSQAEFSSQNNPSAKITLEFSNEEKNAQKEFINVLKNLYIEKLKKEMQKSGD